MPQNEDDNVPGGPALMGLLSLSEYWQQFPRQKTSRWTNPTKNVLRADPMIGPATVPHPITGKPMVHPTTRLRLLWQPGETIETPAEFDEALKSRRLGKGEPAGLAPQLMREGDPLDAPPPTRSRSNSRTVDD